MDPLAVENVLRLDQELADAHLNPENQNRAGTACKGSYIPPHLRNREVPEGVYSKESSG